MYWCHALQEYKVLMYCFTDVQNTSVMLYRCTKYWCNALQVYKADYIKVNYFAQPDFAQHMHKHFINMLKLCQIVTKHEISAIFYCFISLVQILRRFRDILRNCAIEQFQLL